MCSDGVRDYRSSHGQPPPALSLAAQGQIDVDSPQSVCFIGFLELDSRSKTERQTVKPLYKAR